MENLIKTEMKLVEIDDETSWLAASQIEKLFPKK